LQTSGIPRLAVAASLSHARLNERLGRMDEAARSMQRALDEVQWYCRALPGVLGAWYADQVGALTASYLNLVAPPGSSPERSLLTLERLRHFERAAMQGADGSPLDSDLQDSLRGLLARREAAPDDEGLGAELDRALAEARGSCADCEVRTGSFDESGLDVRLKALDASQSVLAYALSGDRAWAVVGGADARRRVDLGSAEPIRDRLQAVHAALAGKRPSAAIPELDEAGQALLAPLSGLLTRRIYLLSSGPLRAVPLDTLRLDGRYVAERARVVSLDSLAALGDPEPRLEDGYRDRVFLAGNPQSQRDPFRFELSASPEIAAVTEQFVGPGLHVVQGVALGRDEFSDPRFADAALLHLALPGVIDLDRPAQSRLLLGGSEETDIGRRGLAPTDLRRSGISAGLVVLSGTAVSGGGPALASYLPLVSDLARAGAAAVVFTLWPIGEDSAAAFARAFYERLAADPNIASAFHGARAEGFPGGALPDFENWSGIQLLIR
jgi:hypothetical protein